MKQFKENKCSGSQVMDGLIFIPDISGFTELVRSTDMQTGIRVTRELLSAVIDQNELELRISEVEGDAVLFYRYGAAPGVDELLRQYDAMAKAFDIKLAELSDSIPASLTLSLKVIAHYGPLTEYRIGPFNKLYGEVVVEAHHLLKNSIESDSYLLLTDELLEQAGGQEDELLQEYGIFSTKLCEVNGSVKIVCFTYFDFSTANTSKVA
jgi:hypothetical protein